MSHHPSHDPAHWDTVVARYETQAAPFTAPFAEAALAALGIRAGMRVLDVATGTGEAAFAAARRGAAVLAIDFSPGMVRQVLARGVPGLEARVMDGQALDLPDAGFDAALSVFGVMLFADWRAGLREMARVVRPGGAAALATWRDPNGAATNLLLARVCGELFPDIDPPMPFTGLAALSDPDRLSAALVEAGFRAPSIGEVTHDFRVPLSAFDEADRMFELMPQWQALDAGQRRAALAEIRARAEQGMVDGVLAIPSTALIATARRP